MHSSTYSKLMAALLPVILIALAGPAEAQRTGDHVVPAIETVCDDDPFNFGLCNAYCEALDCDSDTPLGTPQACANTLRNYLRHSEGALPPCMETCPCEFDFESDFTTLVEGVNANDFELTGQQIENTYMDSCISDEEPTRLDFLAVARTFIPDELSSAEGVALAYWVTEATDEEPASCNELGVGFDDLLELDFDDPIYGPYPDPPVHETLTPGQVPVCLELLEQLCPDE